MNHILILLGIVAILCVLMGHISEKLPIPSLLLFLVLGMLFGVDGIFKIPFDNYQVSEIICSICLIFIMFYGGFGTNFTAAKPVLIKSGLLASVGVILTALFTGLFVHYVFDIVWLESLLIGSVIASTDAASVFAILKREKLNLKDNTASLLEVESGSNDPVSYMLTIVLCTLINGQSVSFVSVLLSQVFIGAITGLILGKITVQLLKRGLIVEDGKTIFVFAVAIISYALASVINGNGYLSVYLCGILIGNSRIPRIHHLVNFFDTLTSLSQMMIFFLLGLLVTPSELPEVFVPALLIMVFLTFVSRPLAVTLTLIPFKTYFSQIGIVSWAGLRGVASIVFAIIAVLSGVKMHFNIFNLVFCIVLLSISIQGTLLPYVSKKLSMIDNKWDVFKTFNDYQYESDINFIKINIDENHVWKNKSLKDIVLPSSFLVVMIIRGDETLIPKGHTILNVGDEIVVAAKEYSDAHHLHINEILVEPGHSWIHSQIKDIHFGKRKLVVMIRRGDNTIIPDGSTEILADDTLIIAKY